MRDALKVVGLFDQADQSEFRSWGSMNMAVREPETPAEMEALKRRPDLMELLLHQRSEHSQRWALINNLLYQGRHEDARRVAALPEQQGHIDVHQAAIDNPDSEWCGCEHRRTTLQPLKHQVIGKSWSERHGGIVTHYRCQYCGHRNATAAPPEEGHDRVALARGRAESRLNTRGGREKRSTAADALKLGGLVDDEGLIRTIDRHPDE